MELAEQKVVVVVLRCDDVRSDLRKSRGQRRSQRAPQRATGFDRLRPSDLPDADTLRRVCPEVPVIRWCAPSFPIPDAELACSSSACR